MEPNSSGRALGKLPSMALDSGFPAGMTDFWRWLKHPANQKVKSTHLYSLLVSSVEMLFFFVFYSAKNKTRQTYREVGTECRGSSNPGKPGCRK